MKVKNKKLVWNVLRSDFNSKRIIDYNIFYDTFKDELYHKYKTKKINNKEELKEEIKRWGMYYYWSKSEHEICVGGLSDRYPQDFEKIDVWRQIEMNLDHIVEYVNNELEIF